MAVLPDDIPSPTLGETAIVEHLEPRLDACAAGETASCLHLSNRLGFLTNDREGQLIAGALKKGCAANVADACAGLAVAYHRRLVAAPAEEEPKALLSRACKANSAFACGQLAEMSLRESNGDKAKASRALAMAKRSCDRHGGYACYLAGQALAHAPDASAKAVPFYGKACRGKDAIACYELGLAYAQGYLGVGRDQATATEFYRQGCEQDMGQACFNLAWQYLRGSGAPHDEAVGQSLLEKSCTLGDASGCDELDRRNPDPARFCGLWGAEACFNLAAKVSRERGETAEAADAIVNAGMLGCRRRHQGACRVLRHLAKDMTRQCRANQNVRDTCMFAALAYEHGLLEEYASSMSGENDVDLALKKSCAAKADVACVRLRARQSAARR